MAEALKAGQPKPQRPPGACLVHFLRVEQWPAFLLRLRPEERRRGGSSPRVLDPPGRHPDVLHHAAQGLRLLPGEGAARCGVKYSLFTIVNFKNT